MLFDEGVGLLDDSLGRQVALKLVFLSLHRRGDFIKLCVHHLKGRLALHSRSMNLIEVDLFRHGLDKVKLLLEQRRRCDLNFSDPSNKPLNLLIVLLYFVFNSSGVLSELVENIYSFFFQEKLVERLGELAPVD